MSVWAGVDDAEFRRMADGEPADWLDGSPMDPAAEPPEPLATLPGFPYMHAGAGCVMVGPTGAGRSSLIEAGLYDAAIQGLRVAYLGSEVNLHEFNARAADLAKRRCDLIDEPLREKLGRVRYLPLNSTIAHAWREPDEWIETCAERYRVLTIDPLSAVASALSLDFDKANAEFIEFYDKLIQPLVDRGLAVVMLDNLGHAIEAQGRAKGVSAKQDRADLLMSCKVSSAPDGLLIVAKKVRTIRAPFARGTAWIFDDDHRRVTPASGTDKAADAFRPTVIMARLAHVITATPGLSKRALREGVKGDNRTIEYALELLIAEGFVDARSEGKALRHYPLRDYAEEPSE